MSVNVIVDVFPAHVLVERTDGSSETLDRVRLIVTEDGAERVHVYRDGPDGPVAAYVGDVVSLVEPRVAQRLREVHQPEFNTYSVVTTDAALTASKMGGCGCGSRLRSFNPFPSIQALSARTR